MREILEFERFVTARYNHDDLKAGEKATIDKQIGDFLELKDAKCVESAQGDKE